MCDTKYETSSRIVWKALPHNVYDCLACYFSYETSMAEEPESFWNHVKFINTRIRIVLKETVVLRRRKIDKQELGLSNEALII